MLKGERGSKWKYCPECGAPLYDSRTCPDCGHVAMERRDADGLATFQEIGEALHCSRHVARRTYFTAMKKLRKVISRAEVLALVTPEPEPPGSTYGAQKPVALSRLNLKQFPLIPKVKK